jgi:hypothetical protein
MKKAIPSFHKGIEFVQLSKLPFEQYTKIKDRFPVGKLLTLDFYGHLLEDCIRYADYEFWFEHLYNQDQRFEIEF